MSGELADLVARVTAARAAREAEEAQTAAARAEERAEARAARDALLQELAALGEAAGAAVRAGKDGLSWRWGEREVRFVPLGDGDRLAVHWTDGVAREGRLAREPALRHRWVLWLSTRAGADREPLAEAGALRLLTRGLGIPDPGAAEPAATTPPTHTGEPSEQTVPTSEDPAAGGTGRRSL
jgi:hypothetical protein